MKKSKIFFILIAILIVVLIAIVILITKSKNNSNKNNRNEQDAIKQVESQLKRIDAEKLQNEIIEELQTSDLNVNLKNDSYEITTVFDTGTKFKEYICAKIEYIQNGEIDSSVEIPCFKINHDGNGKFKSIEYTYEFMTTNIINEAIRNVFKDQYGLNDFDAIIGSQKYERKFSGEGKSGNIYYSQDEFFINVVTEINGPIQINGHVYVFNPGNCQTIIDMFKNYKTFTFGLVSEKN